MIIKLKLNIVTILFSIIFLNGCAGDKGSIDIIQPLFKSVNLSEYDGLEIKTTNNNDVLMTSIDKERIVYLVWYKIQEKAPNRFIRVESPDEALNTIRATINFRRYEKGSAFARSMLAGLGQIHVDADLIIEDIESNTILARYFVTKTFAWGGIYGAVTNLRDVEDGFADTIVSIILQE